MVLRRRDIQLPKPPVTNDKAASNWMTAVSSLLQKYIFGGTDDRLVSAKELIDGGVAGVGTGGQLTLPPRNLTKPPKVSGLTANGAFAAIYVQWNNPSFSNYSHTELWRADVDDIGQAMLIASTAVESYTDNVGSAATKYYWARAVSDQGVKGDFNAVNGVKGTTSLEPEYVKQILTSITWKPNITYYPFQYVRPTVENGFQYAAVDGGKSGSVEPTWPTTINATVDDGTIQWTAVPVDARIPFVLGTLEDGTPAVFIDTAYIKNASITSAKISELIADKIETGNLIADLQVKSKLWYGFNQPNGDFLDPEDNTVTSGKTGFYLGVNGSGSLPVLHLNTGVANGNRQFLFDGTQLTLKNVDLVSSADGDFDDLGVDSLTANRAYAIDLGFRNLFAVSNYVQLDAEGRPIIDDVDVRSYFCWIYGCKKTVSYVTPDDKVILVGNNNRGGVRLQTYDNLAVVPYDYADLNTKYRMKKKAIAFSIKITIPLITRYAQPFYLSLLRIYLFDQTMGFASNLIEGLSEAELESGYAGQYLARLNLRHDSSNKDHFTNMLGANLFEVEVLYQTEEESSYSNSSYATGTVIINCLTDNESLNYVGNRRLKVGVEYEQAIDEHPNDDGDIYARKLQVDFQLIDLPLELNAVSDSPLLLPSVTSPLFTENQLQTINELIAWWNRPEPL